MQILHTQLFHLFCKDIKHIKSALTPDNCDCFDLIMCFQEGGKEDSHSRRHLKRLYPSSEAPPPRTPNKAAPARRHHGNREPASPWWEVSSCWHSKDTQSWGRSEKRQKHVWVHKQDKIVGLKLRRWKSCQVPHPSSAPVIMCSSLISWTQSMEPLCEDTIVTGCQSFSWTWDTTDVSFSTIK